MDVPWARPDLFLPLPGGAGPWGILRRDKDTVVFEQVRDADGLKRQLLEDHAIHFAWTPGDTHVRPVYEVEEAAAEVEARGAEEARRALRQSLPALFATLAALAALVLWWPEDLEHQFIVVILVFFLVLPLWRRGVEGAFEAWRSSRRLKRDPRRWRALEASRIRFATWSGEHTSRVAVALVGAFVVTFLAAWWTGEKAALDRFGLVKEDVRAGEWWRLLSCVFLHGGAMHLFFNSAAGLSLAGIAAALVGEAYVLLAFAASGVAGSVASTLISPVPSIGASGAILGWGGMLLGLALAHKDLRPTGLIANLMRWVVVLALIGVAGMRFIDNAAHAGGLVMGLAIGLWIARDGQRPLPVRAPLSRAGWVMVAAACAAPWLWMVWVLVRARVLGG